jgi:hypothetical protein
MNPMANIVRTLLALLLVLGAGPAQALYRTYLSSSGNDANPCTRSQPCRLLPAAIAATWNGGEVWILDSANYNTGPVTIAKSITVYAVPGATATVVGNGGHAISITAAGVDVALRNLRIVDLVGGQRGVSMTAGAGLLMERCEVVGFAGEGIHVATGAAVVLLEVVARGNQAGLSLAGGAKGTASRSTFADNAAAGVNLDGTGTRLAIEDSTASGNAGAGFLVTNDARLWAIRSAATNNVGTGFLVTQGGALVATANYAGQNAGYGMRNDFGTILSRGDNVLRDNTQGAKLGTITPIAAY